MSKYCCATVLLIGILPILGCAESSDELFEQQITQMNELAEAIETGADEAKMKEIEDAFKATKEKFDALAVSVEEQSRLAKDHGDFKKAMDRLTKAKAQALLKQMGDQLPGMMEDMQKKMGGAMPSISPGDIPTLEFPK